MLVFRQERLKKQLESNTVKLRELPKASGYRGALGNRACSRLAERPPDGNNPTRCTMDNPQPNPIRRERENLRQDALSPLVDAVHRPNVGGDAN